MKRRLSIDMAFVLLILVGEVITALGEE